MSHLSKEKVLVALSGGVDSAVAAYRLIESGYKVSAAYIRTWIHEEGRGIIADCPWQEDIAQAQAVCQHLGIPLEVVDSIEVYSNRVVDYLINGYSKGTTPNPDLMCNREIKFGVFNEYALSKCFDFIATGHYCSKRLNIDSSYCLLEGKDSEKDQSYFLSLIQQEHLKRVLFPIGDLQKPLVRSIANNIGIPNAYRKDSQGICFLGKIPMNVFLSCNIPDNTGPIISLYDRYILGKHRGLHNFTIGQRRSIRIPSNTYNKHYVVVGKNLEDNALIIASNDIYGCKFTLWCLSWLHNPITEYKQLLARPRYREPAVPIRFEPGVNNTADIVFNIPQSTLAIGQFCALYEGSILLGGGFYI